VAGPAVSQLAGVGVDSVLNGLGTWVATGATWLLQQIGTVIGATTSVDLRASWFTAHYETVAALAGMVVAPLLLLGIMQAIYRQNASMLMRSALVNVPLAILLTAVAVKLVQLGLAVTDALSEAVSQGAGLDTGQFMGTVSSALSAAQATGSGAPAFILFLGALAVVFGAVMVWIELLVRAAALYVAVLFLPLALASLAWPAIAHWCRRLVDTLVALVLGKFVIVAVLSLAAGALAGGTGSAPTGTNGGVGASGGGGGFGAVLGGAALLLLAALSPWALFRLLPFVEAGAVGHLEGVSRRAHQAVAAPVRGLAQVAMRSSVAGEALGAGTGAVGSLSGIAGRAGAAGPGPPGGPAPTRSGRFEDTPDPGPSSAETTGVGTAEPPGHSIPSWEVNPQATALARYYLEGPEGLEGREGPEGLDGLDDSAATGYRRTNGQPAREPMLASAAGPATLIPPSADPALSVPGGAGPRHGAGRGDPGDLVALPRASGAHAGAWFGRDELGPRLIADPDRASGSWPGSDGDG
jgi:hypothetical protein